MVVEAKPIAIEEVAAALAGGPFAVVLARNAPLAVATGSRPRLRFATSAALRLVDASDLPDLEARLLDANSPGARRLRQLATMLTAGASPRFERLRFYFRGAPVELSLSSARIVAPGGDIWFVLSAPLSATQSRSTNSRSVPEAAVAEPPSPPLDGPVRFLWSMDAEGRFGASDPALLARLGRNAPKVGEPLGALCARAVLGKAWLEATAARTTYSGVRVAWPEETRARARIVKLSGAPVFERGRTFAGYRGFGVFTGEGVDAPRPLFEASDAAAVETFAPQPEPAQPESASPAESEPRGGAEIVVLRPQAAQPAANVVPIRPGALGVLTSTFEDDEPERGGDSIELSSRERDAFREIARALGVRARSTRDNDPPAPEPVAFLPTPASDLHGDMAQLVDALPIGVLVMRDGRALFANRALLEFAGFDSVEALDRAGGLERMFRGRNPVDLLAGGEDLPMVGAEDEVAMAHAHAQEIEWAGASATLLSLRRSREFEHLRHARALEAEGRAQATRARDYRRALDIAADGFVRLDPSGRILAMNAPARQRFGYEENEAAGETFLMLLAPGSQTAANSALRDALRADPAAGPAPIDVEARERSGRVFPARFSFSKFDGGEGAEAFFVVEDREAAVAAERESEAALATAKLASDRKTELLAVVSHEIRTPINAILGFAEVMMEERFGPIGSERYKDYLKDIHGSATHVVSLASDLIDLAKIETGKLELEFAPVDANQIIRDCIALMQPQASRERIIVRMSLAERLPNVMVDARSLRQIMLNLVSNAVKYNEPGGQVIVSTALDDGGHTVIRVRDTGIGMSEAELGLALEPFKRAGAKTGEGSGLGLPLTKALVEANRGDFSIKSRKDQGTLVEVAFPTARAAQ